MKIKNLIFFSMLFLSVRIDVLCLNAQILQLVELDTSKKSSLTTVINNNRPVMSLNNEELLSKRTTTAFIPGNNKGIVLGQNKPMMKRA